jgi:hypothetical protein
MALLRAGNYHVSPVWGLGGSNQAGPPTLVVNILLEKLEVPDEVATLSLGASNILIQVGLWDVHIFQFGSNLGKVGGKL